MSELSTVAPLTAHDEQRHPEKRPGMVIYDVNGPLFFGAAHKALKVILSVDHQSRSVVLDMADVPARPCSPLRLPAPGHPG
jgi:SulP family sulfate permease